MDYRHYVKGIVVGVGLLSMATANAVSVGTYYSSRANTSVDIFGDGFNGSWSNHGETSAETTFFSPHVAKAAVEGHTLKSYAEIGEITGEDASTNNVSSSANSSFSQVFKVTAAGVASIKFQWDGTLSASGNGSGAGYSFFVTAYDYSENDYYDPWNDKYDNSLNSINAHDSVYASPYGGDQSKTVNESGQLDFYFRDGDVGELFKVTATLSSWANVYGGSGAATADFFNTARMTGFSGNLQLVGAAPVPVPAAVWLFLSGIGTLFGMGRIRNRQKMSECSA